MKELTGDDAQNLIKEQITSHSEGIASRLVSFDAEISVSVWLDTIRAIEEFINLPLHGIDDDRLAQAVFSLRLDDLNPLALKRVGDALKLKFTQGVVERFAWTVVQSAAICTSFRINGNFNAASGLQTVAHAIDYYQSRRRHFVSLLYTLPSACRGKHPLGRLDSINQFLPVIEHSGITLTGLYEKLMLSKVFPDFRLYLDGHGFRANHEYNPLDSEFLEPERVSILEMLPSLKPYNFKQVLEPVDDRLLFSAAELRNDILILEMSYSEFDLAKTDFGPITNFVRACLSYCEDDYLIKLTSSQFDKLASDANLSASMLNHIAHHGGDYVANTNVYCPFIALKDSYISSVTLLSRFMYYWKNICLNRIRRFQIRAGYLFEESVKAALTKQGFTMTDIKRINHKEFDVVAILNGVIYNVQCKNNLVDLGRIESNANLFIRYNRRLETYYSNALIKEENREELLKTKLGLPTVKHIVLSRFPIASSNTRVLSYSRIHQFRSIFTDTF